MLLTHTNGLKIHNFVSFLRLILETMKHIAMLSNSILEHQQVSGSCGFCCSCAGIPTSMWAGAQFESNGIAQVI